MNNHIQEENTPISNFDENDILLGVRNISDPNDLVRFPGFGFWPLWYLEKFREKVSNLSTADTEERKVSGILIFSIRMIATIIIIHYAKNQIYNPCTFYLIIC